ncbi:MAG: hypothetical protein S4CHLAM37_02470 [Chlamydiia bacterium]|nr:hypothetical protein [Chlamydiia bacterium]
MLFTRVFALILATVIVHVSPLSAATSTPKKTVQASKPAAKAPVKKPPTAAKAANPKVSTPTKKVVSKPAAVKPAAKKVASKPTTTKPAPKKAVASAKPAVKKTAPKPAQTPKKAAAPAPKPVAQAKKAVSKPAVKPASAAPKKTTAQTNKPAAPKPVSKPAPKAPAKVVTQKKTTTTPQKKKVSPNNDKLIIIDAGHGGYDVGARVSACNEKSLALSTSLMTKKYLTAMGYRVILTRSRDIFIPLQRRTTIANQTKSKLFVSVHFNSAKSKQAKGIEVFYYNSKDKWRSGSSKKLARRVLSKLIARTGATDRGVKDGNFHVIRETKMPAILVEGGFITHEEERHKLTDSSYREKLARGIAEGIDNYFKG